MSSKYTLKIDLNVLNHLGLNLYSNVAAVLSELVANAWDADATKVQLSISEEELIISDDGCGMNETELNEKFLNVGYERRKKKKADGSVDIVDETPRYKRKVMGRKGIGKLSVFSIADNMEIYTKAKGQNTIGLNLKTEDIRTTIEKGEEYHPIELKEVYKTITQTGTIIVLKDLKKRIKNTINKHLKVRVARRFNIFSDKFKVYIDKELVSIEDRDYFDKLEFATIYGDYDKTFFSKIDEEMIIKRKNIVIVDQKERKIKGWIGFSEKSGDLQGEGDNLNKITIFAREKISLEDILEAYREGGLYTKFLIGEIYADFLDDSYNEDIAISNRQGYIQEEERFIILKKFIHEELKFLEKKRVEYKEKKGISNALIIPTIKGWYEALKGDSKKTAKKLFGRIATIDSDSNRKKELYKYGILAFEYLHFKEQLSRLNIVKDDNFESFIQTFSELDDIEAVWYHSITKARLEAIKTIKKQVSANAIEKVIQKFLYDHLWLLDPSWDRVTDEVHTQIEEKVKVVFNNSSKEITGRIDIRYKKISGSHVIIELKRPEVRPIVGNLIEQCRKYRHALKEILKSEKENNPSIDVICLVGKFPENWEEKDKQTLYQQNMRLIRYTELITDAEKSYIEYIRKQESSLKLQKILEGIDRYNM